jgi:hypothetical protein
VAGEGAAAHPRDQLARRAFLTADGRSLYYLRADPLGNSLYRIVDGREAAVTAERQVVNNTGRLSRDERAITFESRIDSTLVLMIHDIASGTSRWVPRTRDDDLGWLLPGGDAILAGSGDESALDHGRERREPPRDHRHAARRSGRDVRPVGLRPVRVRRVVPGAGRRVGRDSRRDPRRRDPGPVPLRGGTIITLGQFPLRTAMSGSPAGRGTA